MLRLWTLLISVISQALTDHKAIAAEGFIGHKQLSRISDGKLSLNASDYRF
jgi:hypothetical protein